MLAYCRACWGQIHPHAEQHESAASGDGKNRLGLHCQQSGQLSRVSPALQSDAFYTDACRRPEGGRQIQKHGRRQSFVPSTRTDTVHGSKIRSSHSMIQKNTIPIIDSRTIAANWRAMLRSAFAIIMT